MNSELKPKIRFKGFTDDWEQRKLADVGNIITGTTPSTSDESNYNGDYLFVSPADINTNRYIEKTNTTLSKKGFESGRILNEGSVLFVSIGSTIGKVAQTKEKSTTNQQINAIEVNGKNNNNFIYSLLEKHSNNIRAGASTQAVPILNKTSFSLLEFNMPKIIEQEKIGQLFRQIDNLITLHQRKCDKLVELKKSLLEKMFPQNNSVIPEIRFKGFTNDWEQRKAKELCSITTGKSNTQDQVQDGKYPFYIRSDVPVRSNRYLYDEEAVITIGDGNIGRVFHYVNGKFDLHQRCYKMADFKALTAKYFYYYFSTKFYERAMSMTAKATVDSVRLEMISDMEIKFPKDTTEQTIISELLTNLDNLITLHHCKYDKLNKIRQSLLNDMFI